MDNKTNCMRCGTICLRQAGNREARLLRKTTGNGLCVNCCATEFLQSLDVINDPGKDQPAFDPECLQLPHIQKQFAAIMSVGKADARPDEIDWLEVIANWYLPFPKKPRKSR